MKYLPLNKDIFIENRKRFVGQMQKKSIAIFVSNDEVSSNGDAIYNFKQNSDLFWLSGVTQEDSMVILFPDNPDPKYREVLVLVRPNELKEKWDGKRLRVNEAQAMSGITTIVWLDSLDGLLQPWIHLADNIYLDSNENDRKSNLLRTREYRFVDEMKSRYPLHTYLRAAKIMKELRGVKTALEVEVLQKAIDITDNTFRRLLKFIKPGVMEYEIEAEIFHSFLSQRATGPAYGSIIASGDRARTLHYVSNNAECKDRELILMDFGAEYGGYCADLTRTVPVNGKFGRRQKTVYNACLHLHDYAKSILKPGISILDYTDKVGEEATQQFLKIGLIRKSDVKNEDPENRAYRKYLYHGISHHLGIDVHDLGTRTEPIKAGMVFTVEPGIYIEEEQMGIRIENNLWITKNGNKDLMKNIPITVEEIEALMKR
ncbi:MAG: aminopeptidase P N-terminal domain-containing protein [Chitinophagaceae bacterium]|jgi:Xaa-Pro aminopeptidase|nr:aminopeptidase P N-terminal domain-containing protein [Chitinophagaceae bacterium]MBK8300970.1 aminopeptidase P N-terminal domain-containing protein [Chitinophagaceae bacterium]MBK9660342.1 aminopeptidase P N-terminal domain-containing protein [Chitinophagaceae bacterium]MBK9938326.1 aminopeptidase P N-terminal domain-containing protein [Chitinophagaceae bacterium]MBL0070004.1 aminopeptidase P N-terminal domain-containing protein [Chitinophagaceae bacterium]